MQEEQHASGHGLQTPVSLRKVTFDIASDMPIWTMASTHMASRHLHVDSTVVQNEA